MTTGSGMKIKDKEIERILNKEKHKKWLRVSMALYDIEQKLGENIKNFWYYSNDETIIVKTKTEYLRYHIGEDHVEDNNKN